MAEIYESEKIPGLKIRVTSLKGVLPRCARCLKHWPDVGEGPGSWPDVCLRCARVLTEQKYGAGTIRACYCGPGKSMTECNICRGEE